MERLHRACGGAARDSKLPVVLAGDYNIVPEPRDIYVTTSYRDNALVQPEAARRVRSGCSSRAGPMRCARLYPDEPALYTFWDYMRNRWPRNAGMRLDHFLLSKNLVRKLKAGGRRSRGAGQGGRQRSRPGVDRTQALATACCRA